MKKTVYHHPVSNAEFTYEKTLDSMNRNKEKLIKNWGQAAYDMRLRQIKEAICTKQDKGS